MLNGLLPVVPKIVETPKEVILVTLFEVTLAVYTLPNESIVMSKGPPPVVPKVVDTPVGVILVTLFKLTLAT